MNPLLRLLQDEAEKDNDNTAFFAIYSVEDDEASTQAHVLVGSMARVARNLAMTALKKPYVAEILRDAVSMIDNPQNILFSKMTEKALRDNPGLSDNPDSIIDSILGSFRRH